MAAAYMCNWRPAGYQYEILYAHIAIYGQAPTGTRVSRESPSESRELGVIYPLGVYHEFVP